MDPIHPSDSTGPTGRWQSSRSLSRAPANQPAAAVASSSSVFLKSIENKQKKLCKGREKVKGGVCFDRSDFITFPPARRAVSELTSQEIQSIPDRLPHLFLQDSSSLLGFPLLLSFFEFLLLSVCLSSLMAIRLILTDKSSFVTNIKTLIPGRCKRDVINNQTVYRPPDQQSRNLTLCVFPIKKKCEDGGSYSSFAVYDELCWTCKISFFILRSKIDSSFDFSVSRHTLKLLQLLWPSMKWLTV